MISDLINPSNRITLMLTRTVLIYFFTLIAVRVMGKREIGELTPFDLVVSIMMAELGAVVIEDHQAPLMHAIVPIITLSSAQILISYLSLKSEKIRKFLNGRPSILIKNGEIAEEKMKDSRFSIHDLMAQLRANGIFNIADVEFAILETSGDLTVIPKSQKRGLTPEDLNIETEYEGIPAILINDGEINHTNLAKVDLDQEWLESELEKKGIDQVNDVLLATLDTTGELYLSTRNAKDLTTRVKQAIPDHFQD
ncbi:MAG: YetF domain-containing protein [Bacillota bacterium]